MLRHTCTLIIVFTLLLLAQSLVPEEQAALSSIRDAFPVLQRAWNPNISSCSWPGITCDSTKDHVTSWQYTKPLNGTIPEAVGNFSNLRQLWLSGTQLKGTLPNALCLLQPTLSFLILNNNFLHGTLPACIGSLVNLNWLSLSYNNLSGTLPASFQNLGQNIELLDLSYNQFSGPLPSLTCSGDCPNHNKELRFGHNMFNGTLPEQSWFNMNTMTSVSLEYNQLEGTIPASWVLGQGGWWTLSAFRANNNRLSGQIPEFCWSQWFQHLELQNNMFTGTIPNICCGPRSTDDCYIDLSGNSLQGTVPSSIIYSPSSSYPVSPKTLILSNNQLSGTLPIELASNFGVINLDLSHNNLSGVLPESSAGAAPSVGMTEYLRANLSYNHFSGTLDAVFQTWMPSQLDFSRNNFSGSLPFSRIKERFHDSLSFFSVVGNPGLTRYPDYEPFGLELVPGLLSNDSGVGGGSLCSFLSFNGLPNSFQYDPFLFNYTQCICPPGQFGYPPDKCKQCPTNQEGVPLTCYGSNSIDIPANTYIYIGFNDIYYYEACVRDSTTLVGQNPCQHLKNFSVGTDPAVICRDGSEGHLCANCICPPEGDCYYKRSGTCALCSTSIWPTVALSILAFILFLTIFISIPALTFILARRAAGITTPWDRLPVWQRAAFRLQYATSLVPVKILITFSQFSSQLTQWDLFYTQEVFRLLNADVTNYGLACFLRDNYTPVFDFLITLLSPIAVLAILWTCLILSKGFVNCCFTNIAPKKLSLQDIEQDASDPLLADSESDSEIDTAPEKPNPPGNERPWWTMGVSITLSIVSFFYFGTSTNALQAFVKSNQWNSDNSFSSLYPYLDWNDSAVRLMSAIAIPYTILFVAGFPTVQIIILVLIRKRRDSLVVKDAFSTLFAAFNPKVYWWSLIHLLRKVALAVSVSVVPADPFTLPLLVISVLVVFSGIQFQVQPWKNDLDNKMELVGLLVLIFSYYAKQLASAAPAADNHASSLTYIGITVNLLYMLILAGLSIWRAVMDTIETESTKPTPKPDSVPMTLSSARPSLTQVEVPPRAFYPPSRACLSLGNQPDVQEEAPEPESSAVEVSASVDDSIDGDDVEKQV